MNETIVAKISAQLDHVASAIGCLERLLKEDCCTDINDILKTTLNSLKIKEKELTKKFKRAYNDLLELADFLSSVDY